MIFQDYFMFTAYLVIISLGMSMTNHGFGLFQALLGAFCFGWRLRVILLRKRRSLTGTGLANESQLS